MENSKKIILLALLFIIISCKKSVKECQNCETNKDSIIFIDKDLNEIYFRTKAIERHPKLEKSLKANNYYVFYNRVNIYSLNKEVNLQEIINVESFRKINSYYFEDSEFIYFVPQNPTGSYFNILDKKENIKFSKSKDTIYSQYGIFYKGNLVTQKLSTKK
ncbi:hypothetical protein PFY12_10320 [Chryseobacterium camelliae]|uniref:Lipoprotein n=1 Tax=Chryseobacterium camelliae TaxID=1265445 RepID=A0ABY7QIJ6_9FLAO|nr:hypothetical protein [Chryseobacterium camelliae]WBV59452.1 hypothetical protein PFY12_10320 [Chryseobacterium camelliae]